MERPKTSNVNISNGNIKYPIGKSIFAVNLLLKLLLLPLLMLTSKLYKILSFLTKKSSFWKPFLTKRRRHLDDVSAAETIVKC